jgi:hypothetical protein
MCLYYSYTFSLEKYLDLSFGISLNLVNITWSVYWHKQNVAVFIWHLELCAFLIADVNLSACFPFSMLWLWNFYWPRFVYNRNEVNKIFFLYFTVKKWGCIKYNMVRIMFLNMANFAEFSFTFVYFGKQTTYLWTFMKSNILKRKLESTFQWHTENISVI